MNNRPRPVLLQESGNQALVTYVALHEYMPRIAGRRLQVTQVARVRELVEIDHRLVALAQPVEYEVCADEAGSTGDQYRHRLK